MAAAASAGLYARALRRLLIEFIFEPAGVLYICIQYTLALVLVLVCASERSKVRMCVRVCAPTRGRILKQVDCKVTQRQTWTDRSTDQQTNRTHGPNGPNEH